MSVTYNKNDLTAGKIQTRQVPLDADTYYKGQRLALNIDQFCDIGAGDTVLCGVYMGETEALSDGDVRGVIVGGELWSGGVVDNAGAAVVLTLAQKVAYQKLGFYFQD
jgi:hypothetical protein